MIAHRLAALALAVRPIADPERLARWRDASVRRLIDRAYVHVPFVRGVFDGAGLAPRDVRTVGDLSAVPVTAKRDVQEASVERRLADDVARDGLLDRSTSGSTGERVVVKRTWFEERLLNAFRWQALRDYGYRARDRRALVHFSRAEDPGDDQSLQRLAHRMGLFRREVFDGIGDSDVAAAVAAFDPDVVTGMASALARLADDAGAAGHRLRLRFVVTGGELLTEPLRARIAALGAPVHDVYGSNELNLIAWQCPAGAAGYHVCDDAHVVEVLGADRRSHAVGGRRRRVEGPRAARLQKLRLGHRARMRLTRCVAAEDLACVAGASWRQRERASPASGARAIRSSRASARVAAW